MKMCLTVYELADVLCCSRDYAYDLVKQPDFFPAFRLGSKILISVKALDEWIEQQTKKNRRK